MIIAIDEVSHAAQCAGWKSADRPAGMPALGPVANHRPTIIAPRMGSRIERDLSPDPPEGSRRRFMIAGEHVILRAFEREDAERCYRWMNDPNIVRTLKSRYPIAFQNEIEWLDRAMHPSVDERHFAIERRDDRSHIGNASIHDIDWVPRSGWVGLCGSAPTAWNRGYG